jgi:hypothetical protein
MRMNSQTRIIVFTAIALTAVDIAARGLIAQRTQVVHVYRNANEVVTAKEFRLVDDSGNLRAHMFTDEQGEPGLVLYDRTGMKRAQFDTFDAVPSVILCSPDGSWSSYYGMDNNGLGIFDMFGAGGETLASMDVTGRRATFTGSAPGNTFTFQSSNIEVSPR